MASPDFSQNYFELFGLQQAWDNLRGKEAAAPTMKTPFLYKWVRHPIQTGVFIAIWATPDMSYGHLLFAVGYTAYIFIGLHYEEKDLVAEFGADESGILLAEVDLDRAAKHRAGMGFFRDRRPQLYGRLSEDI